MAGGVTRLIVAGGETSGAVVNGLGVTALEIGPEIDPGVPWTRAVGRELVLALKSGNFGAADFFVKAWEKLAWPLSPAHTPSGGWPQSSASGGGTRSAQLDNRCR